MVRNSGIGVEKKKRLNPLNKFKKCAERFSAFQHNIMKDFCAEKFENIRKIQRISSHSSHFLLHYSTPRATLAR